MARAQTPPTTEAEIRLIEQPVSHTPEDELGLVLRIYNFGGSSLEGLRIQVKVYENLTTRSALHESFDGVTAFESGSFTVEVDKPALAPGDSRTITLDQSLLEIPSSSLAGATEGEVFPLTITLLDQNSLPIDALTTHMLLFPTPPETPLDLALLWTLAAPPARAPDGSYSGPGATSMLEGLGEGGWLTGIIDAFESAGQDLRFSLAVTPRLIEELEDISDGYSDAEGQSVSRTSEVSRAAADWLERLRVLVDTGNIQLVAVPYGFADLVALGQHLPPSQATEAIIAQLTEGRRVIEDALEAELGEAWLYPPAGRLDRTTLDLLRSLSVEGHPESVFVSDVSTQPLATPLFAECPENSPTFACSLRIASDLGPVRGLVAEPELQDRLFEVTQEGSAALDIQRFLAEIAMIWAELPGTPSRAVTAVVPPMWEPTPAESKTLLDGLAGAPWLATKKAEEVIEAAQPERRDLLDESLDSANDPGPEYYADAAAAGDLVESFGGIGPPESLSLRLQTNILVAQSRLWWADPAIGSGLAYATDSAEEVRSHLAKIRIGGAEDITLTSSGGTIQFQVVNETGYPVRLKPLLTSEGEKLRFESPELQEFSNDPPITGIELKVTAGSSGISPLNISLETPDGLTVTERRIRVRSTQFNQVALVITVGAALFLILYYTFRSARQRHETAINEVPEEAEDTG